MYKTMFSVIACIILLGGVTSYAEAEMNAPFEYSSLGAEITDFNLDFDNAEVMLDVTITELPALFELGFERDFFDSKKLNQDIEFTILADGEMVYYEEIKNNSQERIIKFSLTSDVELVEIFGTHLKGIANQEQIIQVPEEIPTPIIIDDSEKINELEHEIQQLQEENDLLKKENEELDGRIFELENLVSALEIQVNNLNAIVTEQVKVIYNWVLGYSI